MEQVATDAGEKLTLVAAPAGWGKTTLLAAWAQLERRKRRFAWFSVDPWDNDPVRFWTYAIEAVRTVEPGLGGEALGLLRAPGTRLLESVLPALLNDLEQLRTRIVLVLDDYHAVESVEIHESIGFLLDHLPQSLRVVLATRSDPPLPLGRMRARGELLELRAEELRFNSEEAAALLNDVLRLHLEREDVERLHERTEGWAAGLYLAALSLRGRTDARSFIAAFAGDDRHVVDYLGAEVLRGQPPGVRKFMLRTSVLERLTGPLCDAVTKTSGSAQTLRTIERANLFLVPLDNRREWYRYHHLFGSLLRHELQQTEPELLPELHRRAASWYRGAGAIPDAIHHAIAAGELPEAVDLIAEHWNQLFNQGRLATVTAWLDSLPESVVTAEPRLCIARAWLALDLGRLMEVEGWIDAADRGMGAAGRDAVLRAETAVLRTVFGFKSGDVSGAHEAARKTLRLAPTEAVFPRTAAQCILGITLFWSGDLDRAAGALEKAAETARAAGNDLATSYALGYRALLHAEQNELETADELAAAALRLSDEPGFNEHFVTMMAHLARARVRERRANLAEAASAAFRALRLGLRGAGRLEIAAARLALADVKLATGATDEATALLREARRELQESPDPQTLAAVLERVERRRRPGPPAPAAGIAVDELTDRELSVLRLLDSDLSQREIGAALYVSLNTVKTHVRGIFRKLGASNRREAVDRARTLGMV